MRYQVYHQGVPIGSSELAPSELTVTPFEPNDAYLSVRGVIREASVALWKMGFFHPEGFYPRTTLEALTVALGEAARLPLELRDAHGKLVPADFVNVVERPDTEEDPAVFVRMRHAHGGVPSTRLPPNREGGATSDADA